MPRRLLAVSDRCGQTLPICAKMCGARIPRVMDQVYSCRATCPVMGTLANYSQGRARKMRSEMTRMKVAEADDEVAARTQRGWCATMDLIEGTRR